ncbi:MAG: molybdopterin-binding protein [Actinomycetota bacterium]
MARPTAAVLTVSDGVSSGTRADGSGDAAEELLAGAGFEVSAREVVADERGEIEAALERLAATNALVVTTGGTGFGPRDVTPEATKAVLDREAPGLAEAMRAAGLAHTPMAALSRGTAGTIGEALVVNLPGSPKAVRESLEAVLPILPHAMELSEGMTGAHPAAAVPAGSETPAGGGSTAAAPPEDRVEVTAVKVVAGAPPCRVGMRMTIAPGGPAAGTLGCSEFDTQAVEAAAHAAEHGDATTAVLHHPDGDVEVFIEPHRSPPRVFAVSATDVARALRRHLTPLGYRVVVVEPRRERVAADDEPVVPSLDGAALSERDAVVLTDHDAPYASEVLAEAAGSKARFVGMMSSRRHVARHLDAVRAMGVPDEIIARIHAPVGLDLGRKDADGIALSIAAGVIADANGTDGGWLDR